MTYNSSFTGAQVDESVTKTQAAGTTLLGTGNTPIQPNATNLILDGGAKLGIGTTSPNVPVDIVASSAAINLNLRCRVSNDFSFIQFRSHDGTEGVADIAANRTGANTGNLIFYTASGSAPTERLRIDYSGNVLVGITSPTGAASNTLQGVTLSPSYTWFASNDAMYLQRPNNTDGAFIEFFKGASSVGRIIAAGSTTNYITSSDQRLKENITDAASSATKIDALQVRQFDWKADGKHQEYGLIAQELEPICPDAVSKGETEDDMWGVDYSKLVPLMLKEIQSLRARVAELENK